MALVPLPQPNARVIRESGLPDQHYALYWLSLDAAVRTPSVATTTKAGVVKPDGTTITVAADGTISTVDTEVLSSISNSLGADVPLNNIGSYFDGPTVAQGSVGTWFASGTVSMVDTGAAAFFHVKLWDGTTVIASARTDGLGANVPISASVSGVITSPAGNIRISVNDVSNTTGKILFNGSGNSKDSTLTVIRIG